jgi:enoyl-[acyl-carrier protein] reductase III
MIMNGAFQLSGTFLVTGGTRGIGRAISTQFARAGACVIANYVRDEAAAQELKALAEREQLQVELCRANLMVPEALKQVEAAVTRTAPPLRGFIHCAATGTFRPATELTARHLDWTLAVNTRAFLELVKMLRQRFVSGSSLVAMSSLGAVRAAADYAAVGASKGALEALARHLAVELAPRGIRVNILAAGAVATDAWKAIPGGAERLAEAARRSPLGRLVTPEEVALAAHFLCSPAAAGINGHTLVVDGGVSVLA